MRRLVSLALLAAALVFAATACGPKVRPTPIKYDEDLAGTTRVEPVAGAPVQRPVAPPGKGLRTGTVTRARLAAVLDAGPGAFLRQLEVAPKLTADRFVGWQLVQLVDHASPLFDLDVVPGDVLLAVNGNPLARPDQLQTVWDGLRTATHVSAEIWRGDARLTLDFTVVN